MKAFKMSRGFSLIETLVVVAITGILAAIAVPQFQSYQARSKRSEALSLLQSIALQQERHFSLKRTYSDDIEKLDFIPNDRSLYTYNIVSGDATGFVIEATSKKGLCADAEQDVVRIDNSGRISYPSNGLAPCE